MKDLTTDYDAETVDPTPNARATRRTQPQASQEEGERVRDLDTREGQAEFVVDYWHGKYEAERERAERFEEALRGLVTSLDERWGGFPPPDCEDELEAARRALFPSTPEAE